jgi:hypothetical protein
MEKIVDFTRQNEETSKERLSGIPVKEEQALAFFDALEDGASIEEASKIAGFHRMTGYRVIERYQAKLAGIEKLLAVRAYKAAEDWVQASAVAASKGDHRPAKDLLQTIKAVEPISGDHPSGGVTIVIGTPEQPIRIPAQILELSPGEKTDQSESD